MSENETITSHKLDATAIRAMASFKQVAQKLEVSDEIKNKTISKYYELLESGVSVSNNILLIALCLLITIRVERLPLKLSEIVSSFNRQGHRVTNKNLLHLSRELNIDLNPIRMIPEVYLERIINQLTKDMKIIKKLRKRKTTSEAYGDILLQGSRLILGLLDRKRTGAVQPFALAASVIYLTDRVIADILYDEPILTQNLIEDLTAAKASSIKDHMYRFLNEFYMENRGFIMDQIRNQKKFR
ncbi:MAG: hypothetical protein INQ03_08935 [Candidatus Heimdallarchaeota archaeon]|nr:hypothetical protein [Candidatus Heimdallarchaeota archaeon]